MRKVVSLEKIIAGIALSLMVALLLTSCGRRNAASMSTNAVTAVGVVDSMASGDFASATSDFDSTMKSQLSSDNLAMVWSQLTGQVGTFKARMEIREAVEQGYKVVYVPCQFERGVMDVKIVFDNNGQVAGMFMLPSQAGGGG